MSEPESQPSGNGDRLLPPARLCAVPRPWPEHRPAQVVRRRAGRDRGIDGRLLLFALRRWWLAAISTGLILAAAGAALVWFTFKPQYEAEAWVRIDERPTYLAFEARGDDRSRAFVATQLELLRSPVVLRAALADAKVASMPEIRADDNPLESLAAKLSVKQVGESELYRVTLTLNDRQHPAVIVNAVLDAYFRVRNRDENDRANRVIQLLEKERARREQEVGGLRGDVRSLAKQVTGKDPFAGAGTAPAPPPDSLAGVEDALIRTEVEQEVLKAQWKAQQESPVPGVADVPGWRVDKAVDEHAEVRRMETALAEKEAKLSQIEAASAQGVRDPMYVQIASEIERDKRAAEKFRAGLQQQLRQEMAATLAKERAESIGKLGAEVETRGLQMALLRQQYDGRRKGAERLRGDTLELAFKQDELTRAEKVFDLIAERVVAMRTEQNAPNQVWLVQSAEPPPAPLELYPTRKIALAMLLGLFAPLGLAVLWESRVRRVSGVDCLESQAPLRVLGEVSRLPSRPSVRGLLSSRPGVEAKLFEESIDNLRTSLTLSEEWKDLRVLAVASAAPREGKTSVAAHLAHSLARSSGQRVLLIDADMRCPDVHRLFDVALEPGLAQVLGGEATLEESIVTSWSDYVHLLPAGRLRSSPHRLLAGGSFAALLAEIPADYRYVIIDTPPVLSASEALLFSRSAEACLLCVMQDVSRVEQVKKSYERLSAAGARPVGMVLNGVATRQYSYRYGNYAYSRS